MAQTSRSVQRITYVSQVHDRCVFVGKMRAFLEAPRAGNDTKRAITILVISLYRAMLRCTFPETIIKSNQSFSSIAQKTETVVMENESAVVYLPCIFQFIYIDYNLMTLITHLEYPYMVSIYLIITLKASVCLSVCLCANAS